MSTSRFAALMTTGTGIDWFAELFGGKPPDVHNSWTVALRIAVTEGTGFHLESRKPAPNLGFDNGCSWDLRFERYGPNQTLVLGVYPYGTSDTTAPKFRCPASRVVQLVLVAVSAGTDDGGYTSLTVWLDGAPAVCVGNGTDPTDVSVVTDKLQFPPDQFFPAKISHPETEGSPPLLDLQWWSTALPADQIQAVYRRSWLESARAPDATPDWLSAWLAAPAPDVRLRFSEGGGRTTAELAPGIRSKDHAAGVPGWGPVTLPPVPADLLAASTVEAKRAADRALRAQAAAKAQKIKQAASAATSAANAATQLARQAADQQALAEANAATAALAQAQQLLQEVGSPTGVRASLVNAAEPDRLSLYLDQTAAQSLTLTLTQNLASTLYAPTSGRVQVRFRPGTLDPHRLPPAAKPAGWDITWAPEKDPAEAALQWQSDNAAVLDPAMPLAAGGFTLEAVFVWPIQGNDWKTLFRAPDAGGVGGMHHLLMDSGSTALGGYWNDAFQPSTYSFPDDFPPGVHHLAVTSRDGRHLQYWVDGQRVGTELDRGQTAEGVAWVGGYDGGQSFGPIANVRIWNTVRTPQQLLAAAALVPVETSAQFVSPDLPAASPPPDVARTTGCVLATLTPPVGPGAAAHAFTWPLDGLQPMPGAMRGAKVEVSWSLASASGAPVQGCQQLDLALTYLSTGELMSQLTQLKQAHQLTLSGLADKVVMFETKQLPDPIIAEVVGDSSVLLNTTAAKVVIAFTWASGVGSSTTPSLTLHTSTPSATSSSWGPPSENTSTETGNVGSLGATGTWLRLTFDTTGVTRPGPLAIKVDYDLGSSTLTNFKRRGTLTIPLALRYSSDGVWDNTNFVPTTVFTRPVALVGQPLSITTPSDYQATNDQRATLQLGATGAFELRSKTTVSARDLDGHAGAMETGDLSVHGTATIDGSAQIDGSATVNAWLTVPMVLGSAESLDWKSANTSALAYFLGKGGFTLEALFQWPIPGTDWKTLFRGANELHHLLIQAGSNALGAFWGSTFRPSTYNFPDNFLPGVHHVAVTSRDGRHLQYWVDGKQVGTELDRGQQAEDVAWVGGYNGGQPFGPIANVRVWNQVRTAEQLQRAAACLPLEAGAGPAVPVLPSTQSGTQSGRLTPEGTLIMWSGSIASIPVGWHLCDGRTLSKGSEKRTLPDLRKRFVRGAQGEPGGSGGSDTVTLDTRHLPSHTHAVNDPGHCHAMAKIGTALRYHGGDGEPVDHTGSGVNTTTSTTNIKIESTGEGAKFDILPTYYEVAFLCFLPGWAHVVNPPSAPAAPAGGVNPPSAPVKPSDGGGDDDDSEIDDGEI
jgi:hypothetical protein